MTKWVLRILVAVVLSPVWVPIGVVALAVWLVVKAAEGVGWVFHKILGLLLTSMHFAFTGNWKWVTWDDL